MSVNGELRLRQTAQGQVGANQRICEAAIIRRGHQGRSGWQLGMELQNPPEDFLGLGF